LANLYMRRFVLGWKMLGLEQSLGSRIVTYADDLVILCRKGKAPQASAQSPDPALLAPGQSGRLMAPPRYTAPRPSYASVGHHRDRYRNWHGARLSHPNIHNH
jgi:hypothetical protein